MVRQVDHGQVPLTRRALLGSAAVAAAAAWVPAFRVPAVDAASCAAPPGFPAGVELYQQAYENWSRVIRVEQVWTCAPRTAADVVRVANWAVEAGHRLRPRGRMHGWSPFTVAADETCDSRVVLVDTAAHLTSIDLVDRAGPAVQVGAGVLLERLLEVIGAAGYGMTAAPELGDITLGGVLAIGGHGTGLPALDERRPQGHTYGSLSNLLLSVEAVVWDEEAGRYRLRTFSRDEPACAALLTGLGRCFLTSAVLRVGVDQMLRCRSLLDIPAEELFGAPGAGGRQLSDHLARTGRVGVLWFPFAERPWLRVYEVAPAQPLGSRRVDQPYNYPFTDNIPDELASLAAELVRGNGEATPLFNQLSFAAIAAGLVATGSADIWGASRNILLSLRPSTLRIEQSGQVALVAAGDVQRAVHVWTSEYARLRDEFAERGSYPVNMPVEIRVTGLDHPEDVGLAGAAVPALSPLRADRRHPERDAAVWLNAPTLTGTPGAAGFLRELEQTTTARLSTFATLRPEWSKGWAYDGTAAWADPAALDGGIAAAFAPGEVGSHGWAWAVSQLTRLDPHRLFTSPLLDRLLV